MTPRIKALTDTSGNHSGYVIECPACDYWHMFDSRWSFNGDFENPTFDPSMMVNANREVGIRCHSFVRDGNIQFLDDCDHELRNQTVPLPQISEDQK